MVMCGPLPSAWKIYHTMLNLQPHPNAKPPNSRTSLSSLIMHFLRPSSASCFHQTQDSLPVIHTSPLSTYRCYTGSSHFHTHSSKIKIILLLSYKWILNQLLLHESNLLKISVLRFGDIHLQVQELLHSIIGVGFSPAPLFITITISFPYMKTSSSPTGPPNTNITYNIGVWPSHSDHLPLIPDCSKTFNLQHISCQDLPPSTTWRNLSTQCNFMDFTPTYYQRQRSKGVNV